MQVHRLSYFLYIWPRTLVHTMHVSHLCHNKRCTKPDHLSYEPARINNQRQACKAAARCTGHRGYKKCKITMMVILQKVHVQVLFLFSEIESVAVVCGAGGSDIVCAVHGITEHLLVGFNWFWKDKRSVNEFQNSQKFNCFLISHAWEGKNQLQKNFIQIGLK